LQFNSEGSQAWQLFQLAGSYQQLDFHDASIFHAAGKVEESMQSEVDVDITGAVKEKKEVKKE
jgi:hypothetical protein